MKKMYRLVVTDDFCIENLIDLKVKVIRCDNGTEFKNMVMNQFCEIKGIKREFSIRRTSQQNGVAERKNRTLIEAARTMLADSKLPTTFWAEAVNTACKFDGKDDEGFFVGYSTNRKAFRVFNSRTKIVEENLHVKFIVVGNQSNGNASRKACDNAGKARMETIPSKDYLLLPLSIQDPPFSYSLKDSPDVGFKPSGEEEKKDAEDLGNEGGNPTEGKYSKVSSTEEPRINQEKDDNINSTNNINTASDGNSTNNVNIVSSTFNSAGLEVNVIDVKSAFLYGKIEEEVYVCQPPGFEDQTSMNRVYKRGKIDKTLFIRKDKGDILLVQVYVDDIIFGSTKKSLCTDFEKIMHKKFNRVSMEALFRMMMIHNKSGNVADFAHKKSIYVSRFKYLIASMDIAYALEVLIRGMYNCVDIVADYTQMMIEKLLKMEI
ncbi:putative ribonuclease H-like domain-containing protein [Tanacetum coccineum]